MSQPPQPPPLPNDGSSSRGLGHSTPLVTLAPSAPNVFALPPPQKQAALAVATTDHPLASMNVGDNTPVQNRYSTPSPSGGGIVTPPPLEASATMKNETAPLFISTTTAPATAAATVMTTAKAVPKIVSAPMSPTQSLDTLADAFLQGGSAGLRPAPLPQTPTDLERVRILVERRAWGDVLSMTTNLLRGSSSHYTPIYAALLNFSPDQSFPSLDSHQKEVVELMTLQCHAWLKMRRYNELAVEISRWSSFCHIHHVLGGGGNEENKKKTTAAPSWIPWSLHVLAAASLQYTDLKNKDVATDALWKIRTAILSSTAATTSTTTDNADDNTSSSGSSSTSSTRPLDILCVEHALCNAFVRKKEWRMALECLDRMIRQLPEAAKLEVVANASHPPPSNEDGGSNKEIAAAWLETAYACECFSRQGRILLQLGALEQASNIFQRATLLWKQKVEATTGGGAGATGSSIVAVIPALVANHPAIEQVPAQLQANDGLLAFAYNKYDAALESFRNAVNLMKLSSTSNLTVDGTYRMVRTFSCVV
jgi:hypothetical protein